MNYYLCRYITDNYKALNLAPSKPDYAFKSQVMLTDSEALLNSLSKHMTFETANINFLYNSMQFILDKYSFIHLKETLRIHDAKVHRVSRLKRRIESICSERAYFLTLTFTDDVLATTNEKTRREYVKRYLSSISSNYVANIDYGKLHEREHYHSCIQCEHIDHKLWIYGNLDFKLITSNDDSFLLLSKYVSKLTNHAIKETCKRKAIIYSRKKSDPPT